MESECGPVNTSQKASKTTKGPGNTLNPPVGPLAPSNHNTILNNVTKSKKKTRKKRKQNTSKDAVKKTKKRKTKATKAVPKSNLKGAMKKPLKVVREDPIEWLEGPRDGDNATVKGDIGGSKVMGSNEIVPNYILGTDQHETQEQVHDENVEMTCRVQKVDVAWEHFSLLIEEYLLAAEIKM